MIFFLEKDGEILKMPPSWEINSFVVNCSGKLQRGRQKLKAQPPLHTRGTSTGDPYLYRYTNGLLARLKIQTVYNRNTRRRNIKVYAGIATLASAHEPSAKANKCKKIATVTTEIGHATSHARGVCVSRANRSLLELSVNIGTYLLSC